MQYSHIVTNNQSHLSRAQTLTSRSKTNNNNIQHKSYLTRNNRLRMTYLPPASAPRHHTTHTGSQVISRTPSQLGIRMFNYLTIITFMIQRRPPADCASPTAEGAESPAHEVIACVSATLQCRLECLPGLSSDAPSPHTADQ